MGFILLSMAFGCTHGHFSATGVRTVLVYGIPMNSAVCAKRLLSSFGLGAAFRCMLPWQHNY